MAHDFAGGYIPSGLVAVTNASSKPEPVFTAAQWAAIQTYLTPRTEENDNG